MQFILCPCCGKKTRVRIRADTVLIHFPLFCPKCDKETLVDVKNEELTVVPE